MERLSSTLRSGARAIFGWGGGSQLRELKEALGWRQPLEGPFESVEAREHWDERLWSPVGYGAPPRDRL